MEKDNLNKKNSLFPLITALLSVIICVAALAGIISNGETSNSASATINVTNAATEPTVNINTATKTELMTLPGIGEVKAELIIENRPYSERVFTVYIKHALIYFTGISNWQVVNL